MEIMTDVGSWPKDADDIGSEDGMVLTAVCSGSSRCEPCVFPLIDFRIFLVEIRALAEAVNFFLSPLSGVFLLDGIVTIKTKIK